MVELRLFGHPELRVQGRPLVLPLPHKALALLYYLALAEQPVGRETLATLLWPEAPTPTAKHSLRNLLSVLRKAVGDGLAITHRTVALQAEHIQSIDVVTFQQGVAAMQNVQARAQSPDLALWQATLDLYRGEFLAGFYIHQSEPFEEWTTLRREYLRKQLITNLLALSEAYAATAATEPALACLDRLLEIDSQNEAAYARQIQLLLTVGRRTEALQRYERYRKMLADEFNMTPSPALTALLTELRTQASGQVTVAHRGPEMAKKPTGVTIEPLRVPTLPSTLYQLAPYTIPTNLTQPLSAFVGRRQELVYLGQRLSDADCRLLTIVGPGGMGKTSLALAVGQRLLRTQQADFPDGIYFVSLLDIAVAGNVQPGQTLVDDPPASEAILHTIAEQIGYKLEIGVSPAIQLQAYLRTRRILLILDNFEHLLAGTASIVKLLTQAPQLKVLITSRARLNVRGETVLTLDNLSLPAAAYRAAVEAAQVNPTRSIQDEAWRASEAVDMFVQRAQQFDPTFAISAETIGPVGQICQLVGGLPLGIELATSMLLLLNCSTLATEIAKSLDVLVADTRDLPREQRTLGAVFERSWRLLPLEGQLLLAKLSIFPGSFGREAAEHIAGATSALLRRLLDQSLLSKVGDDRYAIHRTVHAFAQQKLQQLPEQRAALYVQYTHFYLEFLARLEQEQTAAAYATAMEQIQAEIDNVRTAWRWCVDQGNLALLGTSAGSLQDFYQTAGMYPEAIQLLEGALTMVRRAPEDTQRQRLLARLLCYTVQFYRLYPQSGEMKKGEIWANEALALGYHLADPALLGLAYHELARLAQARHDFAAMRPLSEQACTYARQANLPQLTAESLNDLGIALTMTTHPLAGIPHFHEALDYLRQRPNRALEVRIVSNLGLFYLAGHDYQAAYRYLQQRTLQTVFEDWVHLGDLLVALGAYSEAQQEYRQGLVLAQARHIPYWESWLHAGYGRLHRLCGDSAAAQSACRLALQMAQSAGNHFVIQRVQINLGHALADLGDHVAAGDCYQQAITLQKGANWFSCPTDAYAGLAALCLEQNEATAAVPYAEAALALLAQHGLAAAFEPFAVYWTCVRVLKAVGDPRARTVLFAAYQTLQEIANQLEDERLRRSFLENVVANRNLVAAAQATEIVTDPVAKPQPSPFRQPRVPLGRSPRHVEPRLGM